MNTSSRRWVGVFAFILLMLIIALLVWAITSNRQEPKTDTDTSTSINREAYIRSLMENCAPDPVQSWTPEQIMNDLDFFSWALFLYQNCKQQQAESLIWEGWATNEGVYLPNGVPPQVWGSPELIAYALENLPEISGHRAVTPNNEPILYETRMNQANFEYIVNNQLYSKACQIAFFEGVPCTRNNSPLSFPTEAIEIKSAWIILSSDTDDNPRYYAIDTTYIDRNGDQQSITAGLAGYHIASKVFPNWLWATFEQIDNPTATGIEPIDDIPPQTQMVNREVQTILATYYPNLPWQYYELRGTQIDFVDANGNPTILANTLIETDFQRSSSCITCHALATRGSLSQGRLAFFNITDEGMQGYIGNVAGQNYFDSFGEAVCYDGKTDYFFNCQTQENVYRQLDFVWSLREAD